MQRFRRLRLFRTEGRHTEEAVVVIRWRLVSRLLTKNGAKAKATTVLNDTKRQGRKQIQKIHRRKTQQNKNNNKKSAESEEILPGLKSGDQAIKIESNS